MISPVPLHLRFLDRAIRLDFRGEARALATDVATVLGGFLGPETDAASRWVLGADGHRITLDKDDGRPATYADATAALRGVEFEAARALLPDSRLALHASGFVVGGRTVLAIGPSGSGKSTLALEALREGCPVLGDDVVLVEADGSLRGFPRLLKVALPAARRCGLELPADEPWSTAEEGEVWIDPRRVPGVRIATAPPPALLLFPRWVSGHASTASSLPASERMPALLEAVHGEGSPSRVVPDLLEHLSAAPALRLEFGDASAALNQARARIHGV